MIKNKKFEQYNANWPNSYYQISDIEYKKELIKSHNDLEIKKLFNIRYNNKDNDLFMQAWLNLKQLSTEKIYFFNKKRIEKELVNNLKQLCVLDYKYDEYLNNEWLNLFSTLFDICVESGSYRNIAMGIGKVSLKDTYKRICFDIDSVTNILPSKFSLEKDCTNLKNAALNVFFSKFENGEEIWEEYQSDK